MLPSVLQNILEISAGLLTTAIIGRLAANDISAKGLCERIVQLDWAIFRGLGTGAMLLIARAYGAELLDKCRRICAQAYLLCIPLSIIFVSVICAIPRQLLLLMTDEEAVLEIAIPYLRMLVLSSPFTAVMAVNTAIFNGYGDTKTPMLIAAMMNTVNVAGCYCLVFGMGGFCGLGLIGSAVSLVISKGLAALVGAQVLWRRDICFRETADQLRKLKPDAGVMRQIFSGGMPVAAETLFWQFSTIVVSRAIFSYGSDTYAAYLLGLQAELVIQAPTLGFSVASMTLCSYAIAKKDRWLYQNYIRQLLMMAGILAVIATSALWFGSTTFLRFLTDKEYLIPIGASYVSMMAIGEPAQVFTPVVSGVLRAADHKKLPMLSAAMGIWLIRVPAILLTAFVFHGSIFIVWFAIAADQIFRCCFSSAFFLRHKIQNVIPE